MAYTRKVSRRGGGHGGGQGKSKPKASTQTPANALREGVEGALSAARRLRQSADEVRALVREKEQLEGKPGGPRGKIALLEESIASRTRLSGSSREILKQKQDELAAARRRLAEINAKFDQHEAAAGGAVAAAAAAAATVEGVGERGAHVAEQRAAAAEAAIAQAELEARHVNYAGLSMSARKRLHNADRRATRIAKKRNLDKIVLKYKKTVKQLKKITKDLAKPGAAEELHDAADYLSRFSTELLERIRRANKNTGAYLNAALYAPNSASPISPNSPADPNSV